MTTTYSPAGHGARVLERLAIGPRSIADLHDWADGLVDTRKHWHVVAALLRDGLITAPGGVYQLANAGQRALAQLQAGQPVTVLPPQPGARVFAEAAS